VGSEKSSALPLEKLDNVNESTSVETLLAVAQPKKAPETVDPVKTDQPQVKKHTVAEAESLSDIAKLHDIEWKKIYDKNTSIDNPDVIVPGAVLTIPTDDEVVEPRELPVVPKPAPVTTTRRSTVSSTNAVKTTSAPRQVVRGSSSGNLYAPGNCTWHAKSMRPDMPNNLGNARTWVARAAAQGMATGTTPRVGAIAQRNNHVAYVTGVNGDGTINISDMNYRSLYAVTYRTVPANQWSYIY
jgi:surface antigen